MEFPITVRTPQGAIFYHKPIGSIVYRDANGNVVPAPRAGLAQHLAEQHGVAGMTEEKPEALEKLHQALEGSQYEHRVLPSGKIAHVVRISAREATKDLRAREARHLGAGASQTTPTVSVTGPNRTGAGTMTRRRPR